VSSFLHQERSVADMVHPGIFHKVVQVVTLPLLVESFVLHPAMPFQIEHSFFSDFHSFIKDVFHNTTVGY
jgi:hypothetical protein